MMVLKKRFINKKVYGIILLWVVSFLLSSCSNIASIGEELHAESQASGGADNKDETVYYDSSIFLESVPEWEGLPFCYINENKPTFSEEEIWTTTQESLDPLDSLERCGTATSCIGQDGMPTESRGDISTVEPTGWHSDKYDFVEGETLYNRCHLIGYQLSGDDAISRNLITGTSYMNRDGVLQFENAIASYVKKTDNHVMYKVTPVFKGNELLARGVHMEAVSVEDNGEGLSFNVFCYNAQPGIVIDYSTGDNELSEEGTSILDDYKSGKFVMIANTQGVVPGTEANESESKDTSDKTSVAEESIEDETRTMTYVLNTNTHRFHYLDCRSIDDMKEKNKQVEEADRDDLIARGFKPCGNCKP